MLVAGVAAFKGDPAPKTDSGVFLKEWLDDDTFTWLITDDVMAEYDEVLRCLHVRPTVVTTILRLLREEAESVMPTTSIAAHPDPDDAPFWECAESGNADSLVTLNPKHFPQSRLRAQVIAPGDPLPTIRHKPLIKPQRSRTRRRSSK